MFRLGLGLGLGSYGMGNAPKRGGGDMGSPVSGDAVVNTQTDAEVIVNQPGTVRNTQSYAEAMAKCQGVVRNTHTYVEIIRSIA